MFSSAKGGEPICSSSGKSQTQAEPSAKEDEQGFQGAVDTRDTPPYSAFSKRQKQWIILIAALAGWFSTASSFIYFPAIPFLAKDLHVSTESINLTVTSYLIASGIFPSITGAAADKYGRRLVFIVSLGIYGAINIGLAVQRSFAALIALRMFQSAAISGTFSISYGVIGDLTTPAERGGYTGFMSIFLNTPPSVAPLISGLLLIEWSWPSIFWFLSVASLFVFFVTVIFIAETCRVLVGDGSVNVSWLHRPLISTLKPSSRISEKTLKSHDKADSTPFNPLSVLALLKNRATFVAVLCYGIYYTIYSCLQASLSTIFVQVYDVSGLVAGLIYIPFGVACALAAFLAGKIIDRDYIITAKSRGLETYRHKPDSLTNFPIEYARFRTTKYAILICTPLIVGYGWALQVKAHMAIPLILQFFIGFTNQVLFTSLNTLLVDFHPDRSSSVQAANNLIRCELAAAGLAALDPMLTRLGPGWCFVIFASIHGVTLPTLWLLERCGPIWRQVKI